MLQAKSLRLMMTVTRLPADDANYNNPDGGPIAVGSYPHAPSFYGTFDQQGNVAEYVEHRSYGTGGSYGDTRDSPFSSSDRMTYAYYPVSWEKTGFAWSAEHPSRGYPNGQRDPRVHQRCGNQRGEFFERETTRRLVMTALTQTKPTSRSTPAPRLLDGILGDPFTQTLADSFLDLAGGGLTFSAYDGPDWLSLSSDGQLILDTDNDGVVDTAGLDTEKLGEYDVKFRVTGNNDLYVIHETSIEVIHPRRLLRS